jgi:hypothetical protein
MGQPRCQIGRGKRPRCVTTRTKEPGPGPRNTAWHDFGLVPAPTCVSGSSLRGVKVDILAPIAEPAHLMVIEYHLGVDLYALKSSLSLPYIMNVSSEPRGRPTRNMGVSYARPQSSGLPGPPEHACRQSSARRLRARADSMRLRNSLEGDLSRWTDAASRQLWRSASPLR